MGKTVRMNESFDPFDLEDEDEDEDEDKPRRKRDAKRRALDFDTNAHLEEDND